jgi:Restriction endonuclease
MRIPKTPNKDSFREWYAIAKTPPHDADAKWFRTRGLHFERSLFWLLQSEGLLPRTSFRPKNEQVDGAFEWNHRYFLLEAKWHGKPVGMKDLDSFQSKVERKLWGTLGVFISMPGYTRGAANTLVKAKSLTVVLFAQPDMDACFDFNVGFSRVLAAKLRKAAEFGTPDYEFRPTAVTR